MIRRQAHRRTGQGGFLTPGCHPSGFRLDSLDGSLRLINLHLFVECSALLHVKREHETVESEHGLEELRLNSRLYHFIAV